MKHKLVLFQSIRNGGDGSASAFLVESQALAQWDQENLEEGWGEDCIETITLQSDSPIEVLDKVITKYSYVYEMISDSYDTEDNKKIKRFIKKFFPKGLPHCEVVARDSHTAKYKENDVIVDGVVVYTTLMDNDESGEKLQEKLNKFA